MTFSPESQKKQQEQIRLLQHKLALRERDLAEQEFIVDRYLQSRSWRMTSPVRWLVRQLRALAGRPPAMEIPTRRATVAGPEDLSASIGPGQLEPAYPEPQQVLSDLEFKGVVTSFRRTLLKHFLASNAPLDFPKTADPEVSIILVLFNRSELTYACLQSIREAREENLEVIVVDNGSSDDTPLLLDRLRGVRVIRNSENLNFLAAVNQAAEQARGRFILLLNNDAQMLPGALRSALNTMKSAPDIGAVGGRIILLDGTLQEAGSIIWRDGSCLGYGRGDAPFAPQYSFVRDVDYCSAAFLLTSRTVWREMGGFDERFTPAYYEETDYCMRLRECGLRVVYDPLAAILHYEMGSHESSTTAVALQRAHQSIFADRHRATLGTPGSYEPPDLNRTLHARMRHQGSRVLYIDDRVPHPWLGAGFPRAHSVVNALLKHGAFVTVYPLSVPDEEWSVVYADMPREVEVMVGHGISKLERFLETRRDYYDVIFVSRPHNMERLQPILVSHPDWFERVRVIYDAEALFAHRLAGLRKLEGAPMPDEEFQELLSEEMLLAGHADDVVCVSASEAEAFRQHGIDRVSILGHSLTTTPTNAGFEERSGLLFVGPVYEDGTPNAESLVWFLTEVFPRIQAGLGSDLLFTIAGVNESRRVRDLVSGAVRVAGRLPDLTELYGASRVFVAPTRFAAGIPHKVHEAAARGLPVVCTPLLATQLGWSGMELAIAETSEDFAARVIDLYTHASSWEGQRHAALRRVAAECSPREFDERVQEILSNEITPAQRISST